MSVVKAWPEWRTKTRGIVLLVFLLESAVLDTFV